MSKNKEENEEVIVDVQEVYSKTETFIENNKNTLLTVVAAIAIIVGGYFAYNGFYLAPLQDEAQEEMFMAEKYFGQDSMNLAIYGDGVYPGFVNIVEDYSGTKAANLANYYLGIAFLRTGQYEQAIVALNDFDDNDIVIGTIALGAKGDAYMELGDLNKAASNYEKAANRDPNDFTTPLFLKRAGQTYELLGDHESALELYTQIKDEYKSSPEGSDIEKYIARAKSLANN